MPLRNSNPQVHQHQAAQSKFTTLRLRRCRPAILQTTSIQLITTNLACVAHGARTEGTLAKSAPNDGSVYWEQ